MSAKLAADPNTPPEKLAKLAARFPGALLRNLVLPLLLLEQPDWLNNLPPKALAALLAVPSVPATTRALLVQAAARSDDTDLAFSVATDPALSDDALARLEQHDAQRVRDAAHEHPRAVAPADLRAAVGENLRVALSWYSLTDDEVFGCPIDEMLLQVAALPDVCPVAALPRFVEVARISGACNPVLLARPDLTDAQLLALMQPGGEVIGVVDDDVWKRLVPSRQEPGPPGPYPKFSAAALAQMAQGTWMEQLIAAAHPDTPAAARQALADCCPFEVGENPGWTPDELRALVQDPATQRRPKLLQGIASNARTPPDVLEQLLHGPPRSPQAPKLRGARGDARYLVGNYWQVLKWLAGNPNLTEPQAAMLLSRAAFSLRAMPRTSAERAGRDQLYWTYWMQILPCVVAHPATDPALLVWIYLHYPTAAALVENRESRHRRLCEWLPAADFPPALTKTGLKSAYVNALRLPRAAALRELLLASPLVPAGLRAVLAEADPAALPDMPDIYWDADWATDAGDLLKLRLLLADNPAAPPALLAALADDSSPPVSPPVLVQLTRDEAVAVAAAANPATPPERLAQLAASPQAAVRRAALRNPALPAAALPALLEAASPDNLLLLHHPVGRRMLLQAAARANPTACLLLQLALPDELTDELRADMAASPRAAHRLAVAHLPDFRAQLRHDAHALVRAVAEAGTKLT